MNRRVRLYERKGIWWASWTENKVTIRRSTRAASEFEARAVIESWLELPAKRDVLHRESGIVYFVEAIGLDRIKIGWTREGGLGRRLDSLGVYCPVPIVVVGTFRGPMADERAEHRRWASNRVRGEWFRTSPALFRHIRNVNQDLPIREPLVIHRNADEAAPSSKGRT